MITFLSEKSQILNLSFRVLFGQESYCGGQVRNIRPSLPSHFIRRLSPPVFVVYRNRITENEVGNAGSWVAQIHWKCNSPSSIRSWYLVVTYAREEGGMLCLIPNSSYCSTLRIIITIHKLLPIASFLRVAPLKPLSVSASTLLKSESRLSLSLFLVTPSKS